MFKDRRRSWQHARKRMTRNLGVNILAKLWIRSKRIREFRAMYMKRSLRPQVRKYRPLCEGEIRVLHIKPGYSLNAIECDFVYTNLKYPREYTALSYTWGQAAPSIPILLNSDVTLISENLYLALIHLRQRGVTLLWVDALCINQDDLAERASQVSQMKDVYEKATIVQIWLGESNSFTERAFDEFHSLSELLDWDDMVPRQFFDRAAMEANHQGWRAISEILYRPWFRRMWIIQEALSAQQAVMVCGKDCLDLDIFLKLMKSMIRANVLNNIMAHHPNRGELAGGPMRTARKQLEFLVKGKFEAIDWLAQHEFNPTLLNYLAETRWAEATNPLDKVYGIYSLASDTQTLGFWDTTLDNARWIPFKVDYKLSKEELFTNVTRAIISTTKSLDILRFARYEHDVNNLPSWVPNWAKENPHLVPEHISVRPVHAKEHIQWRPMPKTDSTCYEWDEIHRKITRHCRPNFSLAMVATLSVKGINFDTITTLSTHAYPQEKRLLFDPEGEDKTMAVVVMREYLYLVTKWIRNCVDYAKQCSPYPTGQNEWINFWRTVTNHDIMDNKSAPDGFGGLLRDLHEAYQAVSAVEAQSLAEESESSDALSEIVAAAKFSIFASRVPWLSKMNSKCFSKRFATTKKKYMGMVPAATTNGDLVCMIYGCERPFILRKCGKGSYKLIGHGEVAGLSFDEAVVESNFDSEKAEEEKYDFVTRDMNGLVVYTRLKQTEYFALV